MRIVILLSALCTAAAAQDLTKQQTYIAAVFSRGPNWDTAKAAGAQPHFAEHGRNLQQLKTGGRIALGARYGELGMIVFRSGNEQEVRSYFSSDSLVIKDILHMELQPFLPFFKGCIE